MLEVTVIRITGSTEFDYQVHRMQVRLNGCSRLTPESARDALQVAFGQRYGGTVWADDGSYGYRVYEKSARKIYPDHV